MFDKLIKKIKNEIKTDSVNAKNPVSEVLKQSFSSGYGDVEIVTAKIGLALVMIYSDMKLEEKEKAAFRSFVKSETRITDDKIDTLVQKLLSIPEDRLELAYFARTIRDALNEDERANFLFELFGIARSDDECDIHEENDLSVIANYFFIDHKKFIGMKIASKNKQ